jgi:leader peptidase (prepilin peptidase)/N-methyltransferase
VQILIAPVIVCVIGILTGGLINYLSDVLPRFRRLEQPRCIECEAAQPIVSYWLNPWRYQRCGHRRPIRAVIVVLGSVGAAFWMWYLPPVKIGGATGYLLLAYFAVVTVIDLEHRLILHPVTAAGVILCGVIGALRHGVLPTVIGGAVGFLLMLVLYLLGELFTRWLSRRREEPVEEVALGFGDVNLAGVIGLLLGWPGIVPGLILAILLGGLGSIVYLIWMWARRKYQALSAIPYGPFLVLSAVILLYF